MEVLKMNEQEFQRTELLIQETNALLKEIKTLNENIDRKDNIIAGLYEIIVSTKDIELMKRLQTVMLDANFGDKVKEEV
jgi:hypothetical protein